MGKKHKSMSVPLEYYTQLENFFEKFKDVCKDLEISSPTELLRLLANLGRARFLGIVEEVRKGRASKTPGNLKKT